MNPHNFRNSENFTQISKNSSFPSLQHCSQIQRERNNDQIQFSEVRYKFPLNDPITPQNPCTQPNTQLRKQNIAEKKINQSREFFTIFVNRQLATRWIMWSFFSRDSTKDFPYEILENVSGETWNDVIFAFFLTFNIFLLWCWRFFSFVPPHPTLPSG